MGTWARTGETSVVAVGGTTTVAPGAAVSGRIRTLHDLSAGEALIAGAVALVVIAVGVLAVTAAAALGLAIVLGPIAAIIALIVWLARREGRKHELPPAETPSQGPEAGATA